MDESRTPVTGIEILNNPRLNKGTAFTEEERDALKLRGLVPPRVFTLEAQQQRILENYHRAPSDIDRYIFLTALQDRNERLFYRTILDNLEEMVPIIYTPTVGEACKQFDRIFRRSRGLYVTAGDSGRVAQILGNWPERDVKVVVVTDGERILGLGDLGANGMGIPIGKLSLYTVCAGIHPKHCLPIMLDVGTDNDDMLNHPLYLGLNQHRVRGDDYDALVEELILSIQKTYPDAIIQFEDFANRNAIRLLEKYRDRARCFNDDIQGTAAVSLAGVYSAARIQRVPITEQKFLFLGAGSAATGIADLLVAAMVKEGLSASDARRRCWLVDSKGLVVKSRDRLQAHKIPYAHDHERHPDLPSAVNGIRPTVLIGVSGQAGAFTQPVLEAMADINERPVIFALSNPTSNAECTAEQAYRFTNGTAVFAGGSPFAPVEFKGRSFVPGQGNNTYIFPGVGLGVLAAGVDRISDDMFLAAARALADHVSETHLATGRIFPPLDEIRDVSAAVAANVANVAQPQRAHDPTTPGQMRALMYVPDYSRSD